MGSNSLPSCHFTRHHCLHAATYTACKDCPSPTTTDGRCQHRTRPDTCYMPQYDHGHYDLQPCRGCVVYIGLVSGLLPPTSISKMPPRGNWPLWTVNHVHLMLCKLAPWVITHLVAQSQQHCNTADLKSQCTTGANHNVLCGSVHMEGPKEWTGLRGLSLTQSAIIKGQGELLDQVQGRPTSGRQVQNMRPVPIKIMKLTKDIRTTTKIIMHTKEKPLLTLIDTGCSKSCTAATMIGNNKLKFITQPIKIKAATEELYYSQYYINLKFQIERHT
ncbi:hypothetical protein PR048_020858 [Dryococelus australis]|uniref:Uncharacterized protein n=1 Tax=Dryococelus australis TaxID=614101 RepID=A0ABQ9GWN5_9NEOP|nr:hypothetical protein PR048_020858 [Dryococelus australis]